MRIKYIAQDEDSILEEKAISEKNSYKDPIEISINITIERTRYNSVMNRRKTPIIEIIKDLFKPSK